MDEMEIEVPIELPVDNDNFLRFECPHCERQFKWHNGPANAEALEGGFDADLVALTRDSADAQLDGFAPPGALDRTVHHPEGASTGRRFSVSASSSSSCTVRKRGIARR